VIPLPLVTIVLLVFRHEFAELHFQPIALRRLRSALFCRKYMEAFGVCLVAEDFPDKLGVGFALW